MRLPWGRLTLPVVAVLCAATPSHAQTTRTKDLAAGKFLVAQRDGPDSDFAQTVILLTQYGEDGAAGVAINRPTKVPLSRALDDAEAKDRSDPVFVGGPVSLSHVIALLRSKTKLEGATDLVGDVRVIATRALLQKILAAGRGPDSFRVYLGYSGWAPGQLEGEVRNGAWYIFPGDADAVFDADPASVWSRLIAKVEEKMAANPEQRILAILRR